jgi:hypothetical protein
MIIFVFFIFLAFGRFHGNDSHFEKIIQAAVEGLNKFKMEDVAMVTKVQKM